MVHFEMLGVGSTKKRRLKTTELLYTELVIKLNILPKKIYHVIDGRINIEKERLMIL